MESTIHVIRSTRRQLSTLFRDIFSRRLHLLGVLRKASSLAIHLIVIRILSMMGFFVALWLCPVQIFASLGLYLASLNLVNLAVFGRYELLIVDARDEQHCADLVHLCITVASGTLAIALAGGVIISQFSDMQIGLYFAAALLVRSWLRLGLIFATRYGRYDHALKALFPHAIVQPFVLVYLIRFGSDPLVAFILSDIVGHLIAAVSVCISEWRPFSSSFRQPFRYQRVLKMARANIKLPTVNLMSASSAYLFAITPLIFLPGLANGVLAGTLALLIRVLEVPASLTSASLNPILLKVVADHNRDGIQYIPRSTFVIPVIIATLVFGSISLGGFTLNSLNLTPNWHLALTILPVVALFQASIASTSPLIDIATLAGRQRGLLTFNIIAVTVTVSAFLSWNNDPVLALVLAGSVGFTRVVAISIWLLVGNGRNLTSPSDGQPASELPMPLN